VGAVWAAIFMVGIPVALAPTLAAIPMIASTDCVGAGLVRRTGQRRAARARKRDGCAQKEKAGYPHG